MDTNTKAIELLKKYIKMYNDGNTKGGKHYDKYVIWKFNTFLPEANEIVSESENHEKQTYRCNYYKQCNNSRCPYKDPVKNTETGKKQFACLYSNEDIATMLPGSYVNGKWIWQNFDKNIKKEKS